MLFEQLRLHAPSLELTTLLSSHSLLSPTHPYRMAAECWEVWASETHPCEPEGSGRFHFDYADNHQERVLIIEGEAELSPTDGKTAFTIHKGDYVVFHQGFACEWHVTTPMRKHYCYFDEEGNVTQPNNVACDKCGADCFESRTLSSLLYWKWKPFRFEV